MIRAGIAPMVTSGVVMKDLGNRRRRTRVFGPAMRTRAGHRAWMARALVVMIVGLATACSATAAMANAANPTTPDVFSPGSVVQNSNGTVTVTASGTWIWPFGVESDTTSGLHATINHPCDSRTGVGWGVVWNDPGDPGFTETYHTNAGPPYTAVVNVGSQGIDPLNADDHVQYNKAAPCGQFVESNIPTNGDGYDTGVWSSTHVYASYADVPREVCIVTFDLGIAHPPGPHRLSFDNNDNSVQWGLYEDGYWDTATMGKNCSALPPPVQAPIVTAVTTPPPVAPPVVTMPGTTLAFTGAGDSVWATGIVGVLLLLAGMTLYFVDLPRVTLWLLGR
jgi:hypothetical protein